MKVDDLEVSDDDEEDGGWAKSPSDGRQCTYAVLMMTSVVQSALLICSVGFATIKGY